MQVAVISSASEASAARFANKTAIVIDVLRASSTIITALSAGAASITPTETVMEARTLQRDGELLGGERFCRKIVGCDLGNSPQEYSRQAVSGKNIVLTTTNGTRAIHKSLRAEHILIGALINATACAHTAVDLRKDVMIVCAGSHDEFVIEDGLGAGLILQRILDYSQGEVEFDDFGAAMLALWRDSSASLKETLYAGMTGRKLAKLGMGEDIEACSAVDSIAAVPRLNGSLLTISGI